MSLIATERENRGHRDLGPMAAPLRTAPSFLWLVCVLALGLGSAGCNPRVKVEAPDKPIEINVNVRIEQEVRIKLDKAVERTLEENPELFGLEER